MSSGTSWWIFNARNRFCLEDSSGSKLLLPRKWEAGDEGRWAAGRPIPAAPALGDPTRGRSLGGAGKVAQAFGRDGATVVSSWPAVGLVTVVVHLVEDFETAVKLKLSWWLAGGWRWWPPPPTSRQGRRPWVTRRRRGAWWTWWTRPWPARATRCPGSKWWGSPPLSQHGRFSCLQTVDYSRKNSDLVTKTISKFVRCSSHNFLWMVWGGVGRKYLRIKQKPKLNLNYFAMLNWHY